MLEKGEGFVVLGKGGKLCVCMLGDGAGKGDGVRLDKLRTSLSEIIAH